MHSRLFRNAVVLGLLTAVGPFAVDMYLPALPSIGRNLGANTGALQMSLGAFLMTLGIGQLVYGPLSDIFGRKRPLYFGLSVFALASVGCSLAPNIQTLIAFRFLQGLGACAGMVVPLAVVRDLHTGTEAARLMSLLMLVVSVSPILSPIVGTLIISVGSWRGIFWAVTLAVALALVLVGTLLPETRPPSARREGSISGVLSGYATLLRDRNFLRLAAVVAFGIASFFVYLANSSFVLIEHFGLSPRLYSFAFSLNAAAFIGASQLTGRLGTRFGLTRVIRVGVIGHAAAMTCLFASAVAGVDRFDVLVVFLCVGYGFLGLVVPATTALALEEHGPIAGTASALMATLQSIAGLSVIAIVSLFLDGTTRPMITGIAVCATATLFLAQGTRTPARTVPAAVEVAVERVLDS
jgi:DHA1 family bicyclomycin/chloramphenicol resistance-like MFS transporter